MRRVSLLTIIAMLAGLVGILAPALPASADSNVTLDASTCGINGPDVAINGTWAGSTCTVELTGGFQYDVFGGSTLTIPHGTTLLLDNGGLSVFGSVVTKANSSCSKISPFFLSGPL